MASPTTGLTDAGGGSRISAATAQQLIGTYKAEEGWPPDKTRAVWFSLASIGDIQALISETKKALAELKAALSSGTEAEIATKLTVAEVAAKAGLTEEAVLEAMELGSAGPLSIQQFDRQRRSVQPPRPHDPAVDECARSEQTVARHDLVRPDDEVA